MAGDRIERNGSDPEPARDLDESGPDRPPAERVGFGRPPMRTRFKSGASGNPKGRPKGSKNKGFFSERKTMAVEIKKMLERTMPVKENGRLVEKETRELIVHRMGVMALKGHASMLKFLVKFQADEDAKDERERIQAFEDARRYVQFCIEQVEIRRLEGLPRVKFCPNPDDIRFDFESQKVSIVGPKQWSEIDLWKKIDHYLTVFKEYPKLITQQEEELASLDDDDIDYRQSVVQELADMKKALEIAKRLASQMPPENMEFRLRRIGLIKD